MDVNLLQQLELTELFGEDDNILEVEDILENVTLPPMVNPWVFSPPVAGEQEPPPPARKHTGLHRRLALAANIMIYVMCAAVVTVSVLLYSSGGNGSILGYHIYRVESGSMTPTRQADGTMPKGGFRENDAIIVKKAVPEIIAPGDIITFWQDDEHIDIPITHRVVQVIDQGGSNISFVTKGDHNEVHDPEPIPGHRLIGIKVLRIPLFGGIQRVAQAHLWLTVGISAGVMALTFALFFVITRRAEKREEE